MLTAEQCRARAAALRAQADAENDEVGAQSCREMALAFDAMAERTEMRADPSKSMVGNEPANTKSRTAIR
jgi:hypothetical protein